MRAPAAPFRFVGLLFGGWMAVRVLALSLSSAAWPPPDPAGPPSVSAVAGPSRPQRGGTTPVSTPSPLPPGLGPRLFVGSIPAPGAGRMVALAAGDPRTRAATPGAMPTPTPLPSVPIAAAPIPPATTLAPPHPPSRPRSRWSGSAWAYLRDGSTPVLGIGTLGGSQAGVRAAYALAGDGDGPVRLAAAARLSRPLAAHGAEAAVGLDWHPLPGRPLRISVERRVALEPGARDAWSAYAAGGLYRLLPGGIELDGYAQGGVVGARTRDLFADAGLRAARAIPLGRRTLLLGGGLWTAAQPGTTRLDAGPRAALRLPLADATVTLALEGRLRLGGNARPGSGVALTLACDF